jgi:hypothetical protein
MFSSLLILSGAAHAQQYVGSQACAPCHRAIYESYRATPMALSGAPPGGGLTRETFARSSFVDGKSGWRYRISTDPSGYVLNFDRVAGGAPGAKRLVYAIGSGATARSYLVEEDGFLFEAPVAYYSKGGQWALEPGYEGYDYPYLTRPTPPTCLGCHASGLNVVAGSLNRYAKVPYAEGVSCERCHGPGSEHIARVRSGAARNGLAIVNPAKLSGEARDSVCWQCHLNGEARVFRNGKDWNSYRPGDRLSNTLTVFVAEKSGPAAQVTSHAADLAQSGCARAAGGKLWCGSCHDPHTVPTTTGKANWYRARCMQCHDAKACTESKAARDRAADNCIGCHMPKSNASDAAHVVSTDHSIPRRPAPKQAPAPASRLISFGSATASDRDFGVAYAIAAPHQAATEFRDRARQFLERATQAFPNDPEALVYLADIYRNAGRQADAIPLYRRALQLDPAQLTAEVGLGGVAMERGEYAEAIRLWRDALERNSGLELVRANLALAQWKTGDLAGAHATLEKALSLSPAFAPALDLLRRLPPARQ